MSKENNYWIYLSPPYQSGDELEFLKNALESNWLAPGGEYVEQLESKIKEITSRKYCIALNSGTAAIHLALKVLGVGTGDYVICQTFSFVATANPIAYLGAFPVFIDSEWDTWNMDPVLLEAALYDLKKSNIKPKAIIYTHIYGNPAKVNELSEIAKKYEIPIVEDAAEALGAKIEGQSIGQFGKISVLSFNGNKVITTSGGGALLTDDQELAKRVLSLAKQARDEKNIYDHIEVGYNYRMSNISAALGMAQIFYLDEWIKRKRRIFQEYQTIKSGLITLDWIKEQFGAYSNRWLSTFLIEPIQKRDVIIDSLRQNGIESRRFWKPLHLLKIFSIQKAYVNDVATELFSKGICLPSGVGLKKEEQKKIIEVLNTIN